MRIPPSVANYLPVELAALKEITQELAALFGLTLPVSYKEEGYGENIKTKY